MSKTTPNLGLFEYDPSTDGAQTFNIEKALNENWEKLDSSILLALAAAAPYSAAATYAQGAYCTKDGKLYRCTTAISAAETWNAGHWTETTMGAELVSIYTTLANKAAAVHAEQHAAGGSDPITPESIGAAPGGFGLGKIVGKIIYSLAVLDAIDKNGIYFYYNQQEAIGQYPYGQSGHVLHICSDRAHTQFFFPSTTDTRWWMRVRYDFSKTWGAWEFGKTPMDLKVEYRTTERYQGKPVYTKLVDCGALPNATRKSVEHGAQNVQYMLSCQANCTSGYLDSLPYWYSADDYCTVYASTTQIIFNTPKDLSGRTATAVIRYTKTTD